MSSDGAAIMKLHDLPESLTTLGTDGPQAEHMPPGPGRLPLSLLGAIGERVAAAATALQRAGASDPALEALERFGLQLQELRHVLANAAHLRHERVDLGLALLQTLAEWSAEAARRGVELHGPACSVEVEANPAALKHMLDLLLEHALQCGQALRFEVLPPGDGMPCAQVVVNVDLAPPLAETQAASLSWQLLALLARALGWVPERRTGPDGERIVVPLPKA